MPRAHEGCVIGTLTEGAMQIIVVYQVPYALKSHLSWRVTLESEPIENVLQIKPIDLPLIYPILHIAHEKFQMLQFNGAKSSTRCMQCDL